MATASDSDIRSGAVAGGHDQIHTVAIPEIPEDEKHGHSSSSTEGSADNEHHEIETAHAEGEHQ